MLKLTNITKHYITGSSTVEALRGVSLEFRKSEFVAVLGHSGCGKTTLLNIIGGLTLEEPAADLAAVVAVASSYLDRPVPPDLAAIGEVGLTGELRSVNQLEQRLSEAQRLGFKKCLIPARRAEQLRQKYSLELIPVRNVGDALRAVFHKSE